VRRFGGRASLNRQTGLLLLSIPVLAFLVAPVLIVVVVSFSNSGYLQFPPPGFSLQWHRRFLGETGWQNATLVSIEVACLASAVATTCGVGAALSLTRNRLPGQGLLYAALLSPMVIPTIITAIGYYFLARRLKLAGSVLGVAIGEAVLALPIVLITMTTALQGFDKRLEHAALNLGASHWYTFRRVTLPLIAPGVVSSALFAFLSAFDDLLIPLFLGGIRLQTLTVRIWSGLQVELDTTIAAASTFFVALTAIALLVSALLRGRSSS
jgi:putative spermidine/putrescine transport system permease protein